MWNISSCMQCHLQCGNSEPSELHLNKFNQNTTDLITKPRISVLFFNISKRCECDWTKTIIIPWWSREREREYRLSQPEQETATNESKIILIELMLTNNYPLFAHHKSVYNFFEMNNLSSFIHSLIHQYIFSRCMLEWD